MENNNSNGYKQFKSQDAKHDLYATDTYTHSPAHMNARTGTRARAHTHTHDHPPHTHTHTNGRTDTCAHEMHALTHLSLIHI